MCLWACKSRKCSWLLAHDFYPVRELHSSTRILVQDAVFIWGFPKIRGTFLGVPIIRISILGSILGSPYFGKLPYDEHKTTEFGALNTS